MCIRDSILAASGRSLPEIATSHWQRYGRHYFQRHDYEGLEADVADAIVADLRARLPQLVGQTLEGGLTVTLADDFTYTDPIDGSQAKGQGLRVVMGDDARIVLRKSGTGTDGATLRLYLEHWRRDDLNLDPATALAPLAALADTLIGLRQRTGRAEPDVVT